VELQLLQVNDKLPEKVFELLLGTQLKIWYVVIDVLLGTITVVFPATTRTLFLVVYRLPAATVLLFFKLKTLVLVGFVLGNGENC
jgi:hypothetical protein